MHEIGDYDKASDDARAKTRSSPGYRYVTSLYLPPYRRGFIRDPRLSGRLQVSISLAWWNK